MPLDVPQMVIASSGGRQGARRFRLARPVDMNDLDAIGQRFVRRFHSEFRDGTLHLICIANSGYPVGLAAAHNLDLQPHHSRIVISGVDNRAPLNTFAGVERLPKPVRTVLIDNSVKTGETAAVSLKTLASSGIYVDYLVKLVDYDDEAEKESCAYIRGISPNTEICSLYSFTEIES